MEKYKPLIKLIIEVEDLIVLHFFINYFFG
nr:MAG TPA: hypothetical protein [Crassvirales sp.]